MNLSYVFSETFLLSNLLKIIFPFSIAGGELFDRVIEDEFVLTEKACVCFMKQILDGVSFMHSNQIIHLDLKVFFTCILAKSCIFFY